jgi:uncharacterized membrane protein YgcG
MVGSGRDCVGANQNSDCIVVTRNPNTMQTTGNANTNYTVYTPAGNAGPANDIVQFAMNAGDGICVFGVHGSPSAVQAMPGPADGSVLTQANCTQIVLAVCNAGDVRPPQNGISFVSVATYVDRVFTQGSRPVVSCSGGLVVSSSDGELYCVGPNASWNGVNMPPPDASGTSRARVGGATLINSRVDPRDADGGTAMSGWCDDSCVSCAEGAGAGGDDGGSGGSSSGGSSSSSSSSGGGDVAGGGEGGVADEGGP